MSEPIFDYRPKLSVVPLRTRDRPSRVGLIFDKKSGILEWPVGPDGDQGPQGVSSRPWTIVGYVTSEAGLPAGLTSADANKAWANTSTKAVHVWQGYRWHDPIPTGLARPGDAGPPVDLTVGVVTTLAAGSDLTGSITGDAPDRVLSLGLPRGAVGDKGPTRPASLTHATDYVGHPPTQGQALTWAAAAGDRPAGWVGLRPGGLLEQWSIAGTEFSPALVAGGKRDGSSPGGINATITSPQVEVAVVDLAPIDVPYRLICSGVVKIQQGATASGAAVPSTYSSSTRITVTVEDGSSAGAVVIGSGRTDRVNTDQANRIVFDDRVIVVSNGVTSLDPDSMSGVIPAGVSAKVRVLLQRTSNGWWDPVRLYNDEGTDIQLIGMAI